MWIVILTAWYVGTGHENDRRAFVNRTFAQNVWKLSLPLFLEKLPLQPPLFADFMHYIHLEFAAPDINIFCCITWHT